MIKLGVVSPLLAASWNERGTLVSERNKIGASPYFPRKMEGKKKIQIPLLFLSFVAHFWEKKVVSVKKYGGWRARKKRMLCAQQTLFFLQFTFVTFRGKRAHDFSKICFPRKNIKFLSSIVIIPANDMLKMPLQKLKNP